MAGADSITPRSTVPLRLSSVEHDAETSVSSTSREQVLANRLNKRLSDQLARIRAELVNETRSLPESSPPPEKGHRLDILA